MDNQREQFIKDFVQTGKSKGASKDEVAKKLESALKEYDSMAQQPKKQDTRSGLQKAADFLGLGTTLKNINAIAGAKTQRLGTDIAGSVSSGAFNDAQVLVDQAKRTTDSNIKMELLSKARDLMANSQQVSDVVAKNQSGYVRNSGIGEKEMQMSPLEFATRQGAGSTAELASYMLPGAIAGKGATVGARVGTSALRGATAGGLQGLAGATQEADTIGEGALQTLLGVGVGAGTGALLQGGIEAGSGLLNKIQGAKGKVRQKLIDTYKNTLKQNIRDKKFYQQFGGEDKVFNKSIKYKTPATKNGLDRALNEYKPKYNKLMEQETASMAKNGKKIDIAQAFENAKKRVKSKLSYDDSLLKQGMKWFDDNAHKYTKQNKALPKSANNLRKKLDQRVGDLLTADTVGANSARKAFASELRMEFKKQASSKTRDAIEKYHLWSGLLDAMQKEPKAGIVEAGLAGILPGTGALNIPEFIAGKAMRSPGLRRAAATYGIKNIGAAKTITPKITNTSKNIVNPTMAAINRALENYKSKRQERARL